MASLAKANLFPAELESSIFSLVKGKSSLAKLAGAEPIPFNGKDVFTFNFDSDLAIVGEGAAKPAGDATIAPVAIRPIKVVYQMRANEEFMYASEEDKVDVLKAFADGFAAKLAAGLDKMAILGINPADGQASAIIGTNCFDKKVTNVVTYNATTADENIEDAVTAVESGEYVANGVVISPAMRGAIASLRNTDGQRSYPEFAFGAVPATLGGMSLDSNATMGSEKALVGDFSAFRWGIAKELPLEVIQYGDPDGQGDLKKFNQVLLRSEAYIGWAIMTADAFAVVK